MSNNNGNEPPLGENVTVGYAVAQVLMQSDANRLPVFTVRLTDKKVNTAEDAEICALQLSESFSKDTTANQVTMFSAVSIMDAPNGSIISFAINGIALKLKG